MKTICEKTKDRESVPTGELRELTGLLNEENMEICQ